jgi:hypothetical protein
MRLGSTSTLTTSVAPAHPRSAVQLQRWNGRAWQTVASKALSSTSRAAFAIRPTTRGRWQYRVAMSAHTDHALGTSPAVALTVR